MVESATTQYPSLQIELRLHGLRLGLLHGERGDRGEILL